MKNKRKILKIRPFNMANFSGGSGYLVFSLIYQAFALIPGTLIVWLLTLIKLPKDEEGKIIPQKAKKRFNIITIPLTVVAIVAATIFAGYMCYGGILDYGIEILFIGIVPSLCSFFIIRRFHQDIVYKGISVKNAILLSLVIILAVVVLTLLICMFILDPLCDTFDY